MRELFSFRRLLALLAVVLFSPAWSRAAEFSLTRADYLDRVQAVWSGQIAATILAWPHEHQVRSSLWLTNFAKPLTNAPVDDDWYYEMCAIRAFEEQGIELTPEELGRQWVRNRCGSWGSSEQARLNLERGIRAPDCGHPRFNKLWFTIGPQFSADVYGALAPGLVNLAGKMGREFGHVNGYAEGADGAVFMAGMVSLGFREKDPKQIVRAAAKMIDPSSPYRQCLDLLIDMAGHGESFQKIVDAIEDRWHREYPASNNAVANGGIAAAALWFGEGDFLKTVNLAASAADFTDADCNAANAAAVIGAMRGMAGIPEHLVAQLGDRIVGAEMGGVKLSPPVNESISELARRTVAIGEKFLEANGARLDGDRWIIPLDEPVTQPAERFSLGDLMQYWNRDWTLERAGFGGAGGGVGGIRGITHLQNDILATWPRDEVRGVVIRRKSSLAENSVLKFDAGADAGRCWELKVYIDNHLALRRLIEGFPSERRWETIELDLSRFAGREVEIRLYQGILFTDKIAGNALWRHLELR
jgi:hypothetical protein